MLVNQLAEADVLLSEDAVRFFFQICGGHRHLYDSHEMGLGEADQDKYSMGPRTSLQRSQTGVGKRRLG